MTEELRDQGRRVHGAFDPREDPLPGEVDDLTVECPRAAFSRFERRRAGLAGRAFPG